MRAHLTLGADFHLAAVLACVLVASTPAAFADTNITSCGALPQSNTTYILQNDIQSAGTCITIGSKKNVVLDLNGHTITYDNNLSGIPNSGFEIEGNSTTVPANWDLSSAPAATRTSTRSNALAGRWFLKFANPSSNQTIVSDWGTLPPNSESIAYYLKDNAFFSYYLPMKIEVEHESLGIIAASLSNPGNGITFRTPAVAGRYRIRLSYLHEQPAVWQPNTEYRIGEFVRPSSANGAIYMLEKIGTVTTAVNGAAEPAWNITLGGYTQDGNVTWMTTELGNVTTPSVWQPSRSYSLGSYVHSTATPNDGRIYTVVRLRGPRATSGGSEPNWTPLTSNVSTPDATLSWQILPRSDVDIDLVDVRPTRIRGIDASDFATGSTNLTIKNGRVVQGPGGGYLSDALYLYSIEGGSIVENVIAETRGLESAGIAAHYSSGITFRGNTVTTTGEHKFNRHQLSAALMVTSAVNMLIENNTVNSGAAWGGIYAGGLRGNVIRGNHVLTRSVITNHYGIMASGENDVVSGNTVEADPGQGIRMDGNDNLMEDNDITIKSVAPNWDIGRFSLDGIRCNDYWNGTNRNQIVRNNRITLYGKNSPDYDRAEHYLVGITNVSNGPGIVYEGNRIQAIKVDPEVIVTGLMPGSRDTPVLWKNNTITSDDYSMLIGHYSAYTFKARFEGTRFIKGPNAGASYTILAGKPLPSGNVADTVFYNSIIEGSGTLRSIAYTFPGIASYRISWGLSITVKNSENQAVANAPVLVRNAQGETVFDGLTNTSGRIETIELPEADVTGQRMTPNWTAKEFTPYSTTAMIAGRPITKIVTLDSAQEILITDGSGDATPPAAPGRLEVQ